MEYWDAIVREYFHPQGSMRFTLWKDNAGKEAKPFDVGFTILPRFFYVTSQCGVVGMSFSVDGAAERLDASVQGQPLSSTVECKSASWTYRYKSGYTVVLRGPLVAHVQLDTSSRSQQPRYLIKSFNFNASNHERCISLDTIVNGCNHPVPQAGSDEPIQLDLVTLPPEPINAFGIPQMTMRCLEAGTLSESEETSTDDFKIQLAESCELMGDLMEYSHKHEMGPIGEVPLLSMH
jgi:hypothetical protein